MYRSAQDKEPEDDVKTESALSTELEAPVLEASVRKPCVVNLEFGRQPSRSCALQDWRGADSNKVGQAAEKLLLHVREHTQAARAVRSCFVPAGPTRAALGASLPLA